MGLILRIYKPMHTVGDNIELSSHYGIFLGMKNKTAYDVGILSLAVCVMGLPLKSHAHSN